MYNQKLLENLSEVKALTKLAHTIFIKFPSKLPSLQALWGLRFSYSSVDWQNSHQISDYRKLGLEEIKAIICGLN